MRALILICAGSFFSLFSAGCSVTEAPSTPTAPRSSLPDAAWQHQRLLIRSSLADFGTDQYTAAFAAQVAQESAWRGSARSKYADGWAQFTPDTAEWVSSTFARDLGIARPLEANWALPAMVRYMAWIFNRIEHVEPLCDHWSMALSGYNGGPGWVERDRNLCRLVEHRPGGNCNSNRWWGHVENTSTRAEGAFVENREYPRRILFHHLPRYLAAGYRGENICPEAL